VQHFAFPSSMRPEVAGNKSGKGSRATTLGSPLMSPGVADVHAGPFNRSSGRPACAAGARLFRL
jgi:hypothetical protein